MKAEEYIKLCQKVVADYKKEKHDLYRAAGKISGEEPWEETFSEPVHPMLEKIADLAFDIAENYRSSIDDKADWEIIVKTLEDYVSGNWQPTCWLLGAMYGEHRNGKLAHSFSTTVSRQNGKTLIESANQDIKSSLTKIARTINKAQTDERFLQNLAKLAPKTIGKFRLENTSVEKCLTEPYHSAQ